MQEIENRLAKLENEQSKIANLLKDINSSQKVYNRSNLKTDSFLKSSLDSEFEKSLKTESTRLNLNEKLKTVAYPNHPHNGKQHKSNAHSIQSVVTTTDAHSNFLDSTRLEQIKENLIEIGSPEGYIKSN